MAEDRRAAIESPQSYRDALAIFYTLGYLCMMAMLMFFSLPDANKEVFLTLVGIMSGAQLSIIKFYFDGSKGTEAATSANIARSARTEGALQEIAKTVPVAAAVAAAAAPAATAATVAAATGNPIPPAPAPVEPVVTPAPATPEGIIPAAEVAKQPEPPK